MALARNTPLLDDASGFESLGSWGYGFGFRAQVLGFWVEGSRLSVWDIGLRV